MPTYLVRLQPSQSAFRLDHRSFPLVPGVAVSASILIGERSVFRYVFDPLLGGMHLALSEP